MVTDSIPDNFRRFIDPSLDKDTRLMAARGLIPIPPQDLALVLFYLTQDEDPDIVKESEESIKTIPEAAMLRVLNDQDSPSDFIDYIARSTDDENFLQQIILNHNTSDNTYQYLAKTVHSQSLIELISDNHERILGSHKIVESLSNNPAISRSTLDKVIFFITLYLERKGEIPDYIKDLDRKLEESKHYTKQVEESISDVKESFLDNVEISEELIKEDRDEGEETVLSLEELDEKSASYQSSLSKIKDMSLPERLKLCLIGNLEARRILIKDPNKVVALTSIRNPRITDIEISLAAQSTAVSEDILREISKNRDWTRNYEIKYFLVNNPKSPPDVSMNYIRHMRDKDLKVLSKNKNVPGVVSSMARRIVLEKDAHKS